MPTSEIYKYRNACDVLLAPYQQKVSIHGGTGDTSAFMSPLKIFEYMASGKLMLVSDMPVLREVLDNSICMLLPPEDVSAWCQALEQAKDSDLRKRYADEALNTFLAHHTWEARAKAVLKAFP